MLFASWIYISYVNVSLLESSELSLLKLAIVFIHILVTLMCGRLVDLFIMWSNIQAAGTATSFYILVIDLGCVTLGTIWRLALKWLVFSPHEL